MSRFRQPVPHWANHTILPPVSSAMRLSIANAVEHMVFRLELHQIDQYKEFLHPKMNGTTGYLIAHILRLGGYLE